MRGNLVRMLEELGLHKLLGISSVVDLFGSASHLLHTTSAVRYPTFKRGRNYTGSGPQLSRCTFLLRFAREILAPELCKLQGALYIPLGKSVGAVMELLEKEGRIPVGRTLYGFPHPSGLRVARPLVHPAPCLTHYRSYPFILTNRYYQLFYDVIVRVFPEAVALFSVALGNQ